MRLDLLPVGTRAQVESVENVGSLTQRLMEMGVAPGAKVRLVRLAPLGDPLEIEVNDSLLALRKTEARLVLVRAAADRA